MCDMFVEGNVQARPFLKLTSFPFGFYNLHNFIDYFRTLVPFHVIKLATWSLSNVNAEQEELRNKPSPFIRSSTWIVKYLVRLQELKYIQWIQSREQRKLSHFQCPYFQIFLNYKLNITNINNNPKQISTISISLTLISSNNRPPPQTVYNTHYNRQKNKKEMQYQSPIQVKHKEQSKKLQTKYLQDEQFQRDVDQRYKKYMVIYQEALYSDLSSINDDLLICYNRGEVPVYFYFGALQNCRKDNLHKITMFFMKFFIRRPNEDYIFIFVNSKANSDAYGYFKQIFLQLTIDHFLHLRQFILVRPTYYHRAQDYMSFCPFTNYIRNLTAHFYSCVDLCKYLKISPQDFVDIIPKQISQYEFPKLIPRKLSLEDQRINFQGQLLDENQKVLRKQFENVMKSFLIVKPGKQTYHIYDYEVNKFGIPVVLGMLVFYFKTHPHGLREEGLFRKSVSIDEQNQTLSELANKNYDCLLTVSNPHIIANLIKRFFSNLKVPIIPYGQFEKLMHDQGVSDKKLYVKQVIQTLPDLNLRCLMFLLQFLIDDVISLESFNKMTAQNISICFAPCLLRAEKASAADIIYASKCAIATKILLDNFQSIFGDRISIEKMYRKSQQNSSKDINQQIEQSIRAEKNERLSNNSDRSSERQKKNDPQAFNKFRMTQIPTVEKKEETQKIYQSSRYSGGKNISIGKEQSNLYQKRASQVNAPQS